MKVSIRYQLLLYMLASIGIFIALLSFSISFVVEDYYLEQKKDTIRKSCEKIEELIPNDITLYDNGSSSLTNEQNIDLLDAMNATGITATIGYEDGRIFYPYFNIRQVNTLEDATMGISLNTSAATDGFTTTKVSSPSLFLSFHQEQEDEDIPYETTGSATTSVTDVPVETTDKLPVKLKQNDAYFMYEVIVANFDESVNSYTVLPGGQEESFFAIIENDGQTIQYQTLCYQKQLPNGLLILGKMSMNTISEGVAIISRLMTVISGIVILFTGLWAIYISGKFTKPIREINLIANQMSNLDFSKTINVKRHDEIGELSDNINNLSSRLDNTIRELYEKNEQLEEDIDKERKIEQMRKEFIANVSHELKTPIFLIQGYAEGLKSNVSKDEAKKDFYCSVISEESDKMNSLVKDLLTLSRLEYKQLPSERTVFDLQEMVVNTLEKYDYTFSQKQIKLQLICQGSVFIYSHREEIEQVFTNLLNNAIDHTDYENALKITLLEEENAVKVSVFNSGRPIKEEALSRVWDSFYKADESRSREVGGAGLGLSIVAAIMRSHNQPYGVTNHENGVEFYFYCERSFVN